MSYGPPRPSAIRYAGAIVQGRIEACPTVVDANPLALDYKSNLSLDYGTKPSYKVRQPRSSRGVSGDDPEGGAGRGVPRRRLRNRLPREAREVARQALRPGCEELALRIRVMPEPEARPRVKNRHGGAPRGERPASWDARRLASAWRAAS